MFLDNIHRWLDGTPCMPGGTQYTNWCSCGPNGGNPQNGNENHMLISASNGKWIDWYGTGYNRYICESGLI